MKKTLIALAALAATGAFAQSTANITGTIGFGHQQSSNGDAGAATPTRTANQSGFTNTDISVTVAASEDLGGGLRASGAVTFDSTDGTFGGTNPLLVRNKSIALSGGFGTVSLANTRSADLITRGMVAPTALPQGMYDNSGIIARAPVDVVTYTLPAMSGFAPYAQYVESNVDGSMNNAQRTYVVGGNFTSGPLTAGAAYKLAKTKTTLVAAGASTPAFQSHKNNLEAFVTYNLGVAIVGVGFDQARYAGDKAATSFGISVPMGALTLGANFASRQAGATPANDAATSPVAAVAAKKRTVTELVAKYDLSRRTFVHLSWGDQSYDEFAGSATVAAQDGKQHRLGLVHTF